MHISSHLTKVKVGVSKFTDGLLLEDIAWRLG